MLDCPTQRIGFRPNDEVEQTRVTGQHRSRSDFEVGIVDSHLTIAVKEVRVYKKPEIWPEGQNFVCLLMYLFLAYSLAVRKLCALYTQCSP